MKKPVSKISKLKLILIAAVLVVAGFLTFKSMMVSPQVALIANGGDQPASCVSNVGSFTATDSCGQGMVNRVDYTCLNNDKKGYEGGVKGDCIDTYAAYVRATGYCGQTCTTPTATPQPSCVPNPCTNGALCKLMALPEGQSYCPIATTAPSPSPRPSLTPQPSSNTGYWQAKCRVRAYRLNPGDDVTKSPMTYATLDREIDHSSNRVKAGDSYAFLLEVSTIDMPSSIATISASTNNLHGFEEPFVIKSTSSNCNADSKSKFMSCSGRPGVNLPKLLSNTPTLLDFGMIVTVQPEIEKLYNTSFTINPYLISSLGNGVGASCTVMMLHDSSTTTPTPVPTPGPGCYTEQRFCIQSLVGGKCPAATVCPAPTPTPTPTPVPSPVYSSKPSATPTPISCGTTLNKWQFRESCGTKMYRYIDFNCSGTTQSQVFGNPNICKSETEWVAEARTACMNATCVSPIPTPQTTTNAAPIATLAPRSVTRQSFAQCFKTCRDNKRRAMSCVRYCMR